MQEVVFRSRLLEDGHLYCPEKYARSSAEFRVIVSIPDSPTKKYKRPYGLCRGEFVVPDDFDAPLPEEILQDFEVK